MELDKFKSAQEQLKKELIIEDCFEKLDTVGGADVSYSGGKGFSTVVVMVLDSFEPVEDRMFIGRPRFPYVPNFLSFREAWFIIRAFNLLDSKPDILLIDGHGIAHPRNMGLASHVGLLLDTPTIGVAKSPLTGACSAPDEAGACEVFLDGRIVGFALKRKRGVRPVFISPGHKVSLESSLEIAKKAIKNHKLPEPLRLAHLLSKKAANAEKS